MRGEVQQFLEKHSTARSLETAAVVAILQRYQDGAAAAYREHRPGEITASTATPSVTSGTTIAPTSPAADMMPYLSTGYEDFSEYSFQDPGGGLGLVDLELFHDLGAQQSEWEYDLRSAN